MRATLEIEAGGEALYVRLLPPDLTQIRRLAGASAAGSSLPLSDATARRLRNLGLPIVQDDAGWQIEPDSKIREIHPA